MPAFPAISEYSRSACGALLIGVLLSGGSLSAQQIRFGFGMPSTEVELTPPHVDTISGATSARLEQARALAAARDWGEAIDISRELAGDSSERVVALDADRYVSLRTYCNLQLSRLPSDGLAAYRRRVDAVAEPIYREGIAKRDEQLLARVADEFFCSSWGDDALLALGEIALERGDYGEARSYWEQISPMLRAPDGTPMWLALRNIDLKSKWPEVERRWNARDKPADWLAYPDTSLDLASVAARLVLASIRAGDFERAVLELDVFRRLYPDAIGQLGGQRESYVNALERLLRSARDWPAIPTPSDWSTYGGSPARGKIAHALGLVLEPSWKNPIPITPLNYSRMSVEQFEDAQHNVSGQVSAPTQREAQQTPTLFPVVVDRTILFADGLGIRAADLETGKPTITPNGLLYQTEASEQKRVEVPPMGVSGVAHGVPRFTMTVADGIAYARVGDLTTSHTQGRASAAGDRIIGLDLRREGLLTFSRAREDGEWSFDGAPVCDGGRIFVAMRRSDVTPHAYVACFDAATGARRWRTSIGAADTPGSAIGDEITHNLLTLVENRLYFNTNLGLVAAIDADTGAVRWITRYDRFKRKIDPLGQTAPVHFDRDPSPCVYQEGLLLVAPADTPAIFALDADTGKTIWRQDQLPNVLHLLGVADSQLIASGHTLAALDFATGQIKWAWPESESAGIRGMGRGVVAGNEVFWPTRNAIYVIDVKTGAQTRPPISTSPLEGGANLAVADGRLIVAGCNKLFVLGPPAAATRPEAKASSMQSAPGRTGRLNDQSIIGRTKVVSENP